ncbi:SusC/RagA family TonB-linked outer membrane protein [Mucilaginibacter daejeonensis]|uniref:SusC/RagA family TonB-linked outer membrane protein n=1 Tax=Mucilaginibacter daejeonensis TaxID=398049 RepID=UPI001D177E37|nr:SusC/RagA family TonB-linked outer membrane protein [Mucilaginibacter daejeonensis]UEG52487.1 SusC/RagA family TonB-linked outer membrane protein [Mucilaginibacter daejeonensis]
MRSNLICKKGKPFILLLLLALIFNLQAALAQDGRITGVVVDTKGEALPAVTVTVKGKNRATSTDANGKFGITAASGDVLVVTYIGSAPKEVAVTGDKTYTIQLAESNNALKDVVVVGYGTTTRKAISSSITQVKQEDLNRGAIADVGQLLQGKVPGLNITASGDPNKPAAVILRGASTVNSPGSPFYVIDGIPGADIAAVAPNDIVTIDVLKDAAATAIYGNRAAAGVIMVTTRRGKKGSSIVTYSGYAGIEKVSNQLDLMNGDEIRAFLTKNNTSFASGNDFNQNTDWMKTIERSTAFSQNHNVSLSGGGEHGTYSASINYFKKNGILQGSSLERVIGRLAVDQYALNDKLKFSLNLSNSTSNSNNVPLQNVVLLQAAKHLPVNPIYNADGSYFENFNTTGYYNPIAIRNNAQDNTKYNVLLGSFVTEAKLPFGFTYNVNLSYQRTTSSHGEFYGSYYNNYPSAGFYNNPDPGIGVVHSLVNFGKNGSALRSEYSNTIKTLETFLTWNKKLGDHSINAVLGYSYQENVNGDGVQATSTNFPADNVGFNNLVIGNPYGVSGYTIDLGNPQAYGKILLISDFLRINYSYKDKYLFQGSVRRDGSSVFGANNRWGYFPAASVAWRISQEEFMKDQSLFSELKLRGSYGVTGNSFGIGAYTGRLLYGLSGRYYNNGVLAGAYSPIQGQNPDLKWERTASTNIGLDFAILKNRITGSVDVYDKKTTDMLFGYNVSAALVPGGFINANGGSISNKGIEVQLSANAVSNKDFTWSTTINAAYNKNKVTSLQSPYANRDSVLYSSPEGPGQSGNTLQILKVGYPLGQFFAFKYAGKDGNGNSLFYKRDGSTTTQPLTGTDYFYLGSPQPKLLMGWNNSFRYKNFDLNIFLRGTFGNKIFNATRADLSNTTAANVNNILRSAADDKTTDVRNPWYSDRYLENGSYVRLDNSTIGYNIKQPIKSISNIRVYLTGNNLFVITGYKGIDPEINQGGQSPGVDYNNFYPKTRTFLLGVNVSL